MSIAQELTTKILPLPAFTAISLETVGDLIIEYNTKHSFTIEAEPKVVASISAKVEGNVLRIIANKDFNTQKTIKLKVSLPNCDQIALLSSGDILIEKWKTDKLDLLVSGSGTITAFSINAGKISAKIDGAGDIILSGKILSLRADIDGSGTIEASKLITSSAKSSINGSGDINLHVTEVLHASVAGSGTITYMGNPKLTTSISGTGEIVNQAL